MVEITIEQFIKRFIKDQDNIPTIVIVDDIKFYDRTKKGNYKNKENEYLKEYLNKKYNNNIYKINGKTIKFTENT